jgi:hypothetical protein
VVIVTAHAHDNLGRKDLKDILEDKSFRGPKFYLEKPIDEETYVRMVCESVGVEYEEAETPEKAEKQRREVEELIKDADPETIAEVLKRLRGKG